MGMTCGLAGVLLVALLHSQALAFAGTSEESALGLVVLPDPVAGAIHITETEAIHAAAGTTGGGEGDTPVSDAHASEIGNGGIDGSSAGGGGATNSTRALLSELGPVDIPIAFAMGRIRRGRLLEHPIRRRIMDELRRQPGIHHRLLLRRLGVSNGTLAHHLFQLERAGYLRASSANGRKHLYLAGDQPDCQDCLITERQREILGALPDGGDAAISELSRIVGLGEGGVAYHVQRLRNLGLVCARREGHAFVFSRAHGGPTLKVCTTNDSPA